MKYFRHTLLFIILLELLSIFAWHMLEFSYIIFWVILLLTFVLALRKLSWGIYIVLAELIIGSQGYLFSFEHASTFISIRIGLFIIIMLAWLINLLIHDQLPKYYQELKEFKFLKYYIYLAIVIAWGFIWAIIRGNNFGNIFLDFNNWLFFLYLFPLLSVAKEKEFWANLYYVLIASLSWLAAKTLILLYIFSHQFVWALPELYKWVRDTKIGEITFISNNFYRIFIQSQIYALLAFFILLPKALFHHEKMKNIIFPILFLSVVMVSFSRSFWVGLGSGLILSFIFLLFYYKQSFKKVLYSFSKLIIIIFFSFTIIFIILQLPPTIKGESLSSLVTKRVTQTEAAGSSRLNMLKPLSRAIAAHPVVGSGFGTSVTYISLDPRVLSTTAGASGTYSTYAFEWSYLDMLLKIGLIGVSIYFLLIFKIVQSLYLKMSQNYFGIILALSALVILNIFTPFLNHPLGIGFILLSSTFTQYKS